MNNKFDQKNWHETESAIIERITDVMKLMLPAGKVSGTEYRIGDVHGNAGDSLSICLAGDKVGLWIDHATQESGVIMEFIAAHFDLCIATESNSVLIKAEGILSDLDSGTVAPNVSKNPPLKKVAEWDYLNAQGEYIWSIVRFEDSAGKKTIRPQNKSTGAYKAHPAPRPLYNLQGISTAEQVIIVEGEKCAQALIDAGYCATTAMAGANSPSDKTNWAPLKGKTVLVWPDNDQPGMNYAFNSGKAALAAGATSSTILSIPTDKPKGWDVADALDESSTFDLTSFIENGLEHGSVLHLDTTSNNASVDAESLHIEAIVDRLNKKHALVAVAGQTFILTMTTNYKGEPEYLLGSFADMKNQYANERSVARSLLNAKRDVSIAEIWMKHPRRLTYQGIVFAPQGAPEQFFNLFQGFEVEPVKGDCGLYLAHLLDNICQGNKEYFEYLLNWMAHTIQKPNELPGIAIVFRGPQGVGKGVATGEFGLLFGAHYIVLSNMEQLVGRFTGHLKDKLVVYVNEAIWGGNKAVEGVLKAMITDPDASVEQKFKDVMKVDNFKRLMFSSNEDWAVPVGKDDRRYFVLDVGSLHKEDHQYFDSIINQMRNGGSEALMYELMNRDLSGFNVRKLPSTPYNFELKLHSMDSSDQFIYEHLRNSSPESWDIYVQKSILHAEYSSWCSNLGTKYKHSASIFGKHLKRIMPETNESKIVTSSPGMPIKRAMHYVFPCLESCRSAFEKACKSGPDIWGL